jgi:hypothetical protein
VCYGADNNDDGVGSILTTTAIAYGTTRRSKTRQNVVRIPLHKTVHLLLKT